MKTIFQIIVVARKYNKAIDDILRKHDTGKEGSVYWAYVPKLYDDYFSASRAIEYLQDHMTNNDESYEEIVDNYIYFCREAVDEIIDGLREAHELYDFQHMEANLLGAQACFDYLEIIWEFWKDVL